MHPLRDNPVVHDFAEAARAFIAQVESPPKEGFARSTSSLLARLYDLGIRLPDVEPGEVDTPRVRLANAEALLNAIGKNDSYWLAFPPLEVESQVAGAISEDLTSAYEDVASALALFDRGDDDALRTAVWDWRFSMNIHTGKHIVGAISALHERATRVDNG